MTEIELKDLRIQEELSLGGLSVAVEKVGDNKVFRPLTITENGTYDGGMEDGKFIGYTPVTVDVKPNTVPLTVTENGVYENVQGFSPVTVDVQLGIKPLEVTENGTYTAAEGEAFNPVTVNIQGTIKQFIDTFKEASYLFYYKTATDEQIASVIKYDDTANAKSLTGMFRFSKGIKNPPLFDTLNVSSAQHMFATSEVEVIPAYDFRNASTFVSMFTDCYALKECWVKNLAYNLQVGSGTTYGHLLTVESLLHLIKELRYPSYGSRTLTIGSANLEKIANAYVRLVEITDEMRAEDDLIDEKLPFEVCESTDEGAMWIVDYVLLKKWELN